MNWAGLEQKYGLKGLSLSELRRRWAEAWGIQPHRYISRSMLVKSLVFKLHEKAGYGLSADDQDRLDQMIKAYKRNPKCFGDYAVRIKPGTQFVRYWKGQKHSVTVQKKGFEYNGGIFSSLSEIASTITGTRWNGWVFFGIKRNRKDSQESS